MSILETLLHYLSKICRYIGLRNKPLWQVLGEPTPTKVRQRALKYLSHGRTSPPCTSQSQKGPLLIPDLVGRVGQSDTIVELSSARIVCK